VVLVHRIDGEAVFLNPDLIELVEAVGHGTRITLVDGRSVEVIEAPPAIADRVRDFRAAVLVEAERQAGIGGVALRALPDLEP
jgi:uncharacterized protein YlzI (FlbEa/FlbD family)